MHQRRVGMIVGSIVLSITLGVLIGLLIYTVRVQRTDQTTAPPATSSSSTSQNPAADGNTDAIDDGAPITVGEPVMSGGKSTARVPPTSLAHATETDLSRSASGAVTDARSDRVTPGENTSTQSSTLGTRSAGSVDVADGPCDDLGSSSESADGVTLYCQHALDDGTLRWRAVTDGGGCLHQETTGIAADGHRYTCTLGADNLNHWVR